MAASGAGYNKDLFILPFDHRGSFETGLIGVSGADVPPESVGVLSGYKRIIYDGYLEAVAGGVSPDTSAILVDQQYGAEILSDARQRGFTACTCIEKSGQAEFDFEYGAAFLEKLLESKVAFAKALVRYNPDGDGDMNRRQRGRLKVASDAVHAAGLKFMFELLVPPTPEQSAASGSFDADLRPNLMAQAIAQLQDDGIEPGAARGLQVPAPTRRFRGVDPERHGGPTRRESGPRLGQVRAGGVLPGGVHSILQVEDQDVGAARCRLPDHAAPVPRDIEQRSAGGLRNR